MAKNKKHIKPEFNEVTVAGGSNMGSLFSDKTMEATPTNIKKWRGFLIDHQVASTWNQRKLSVMAVDYEVIPGGDDAVDIAAADDLRDQLANINFNAAFRKMHFGKYFGFSVAELMWSKTGLRVTLDQIKVRRPENFKFDPKTGDLKFLGGGNPQGEFLPDNKMWIYTVDGDSDDAPHGPPIGWQLYWPIFLKQNGAQFWAVAVEKYGMPTATGQYPQGADKKAQENLMDALLAIHSQSAVAFPEGFEVKLLEAVRTSGGDYQKFLEYWDRAISKVIVGQTMTTDDGSSKSQATVHKSILDIIVQADADDICDSFNDTAAKWLTAWNFPNAKTPNVQRRIKKAEDLGAKATRDKALSEAAGAKLTNQYVKDHYGIELEEKTNDPRNEPTNDNSAFSDPVKNQNGNFIQQFSDPDDITSLADQLDDVTSIEVEAMIDEAKQILNTSNSVEEFSERLLKLSGEQDNQQLANIIAGGTAVAAMMGQADVDDD